MTLTHLVSLKVELEVRAVEMAWPIAKARIKKSI